MFRKNNIEVAWVPKSQIREALQVFRDYVFDVTTTDESVRLVDLIKEVLAGETRLGVAYQVDEFKPLGCWFSDLRVEDGVSFATIFGLSGEQPQKWAHGVAKLLEEWVKEENCYSYRWYGRLGWLRFEKDIKLLKPINDREGLFEKVVNP